MKMIVSSLVIAIVIAAGASFVLNSSFQKSAETAFVGSGADVRDSAGHNLIGHN